MSDLKKMQNAIEYESIDASPIKDFFVSMLTRLLSIARACASS